MLVAAARHRCQAYADLHGPLNLLSVLLYAPVALLAWPVKTCTLDLRVMGLNVRPRRGLAHLRAFWALGSRRNWMLR